METTWKVSPQYGGSRNFLAEPFLCWASVIDLSTTDTFGDTQSEPEAEAIQQLVSTAIAVNYKRRTWRQDLILSAAIGALVSGDRTTEQLLTEINQVWHTESLTRPLLEKALGDAHAAGLVVAIDDLSGIKRWQATPGAQQQTRQDRDWVDSLTESFYHEVLARLDEDAPSLTANSRSKAPHHLICALAAGASATYKVTTNRASGLRPVTFDDSAVQKYIESVEPKNARAALLELADVAIDPNDDFGTEIVHLLVVGSLLHGMLTRRDVSTAPSFEGTRLLLDTSELLGLIEEDKPEQQLMRDLIENSTRLGVEVLVADHTVDEWSRLWQAAENEIPADIDSRHLPDRADRLPGNPFVAEFMSRKNLDTKLSWASFRIQVSSLNVLLTSLPVTVRPAGNHLPDDVEVRDQALEILRELSDDQGVRGSRSQAAAAADSESLAMCARWRRRNSSPRCAAYFIANDQLTSRAYSQIVPQDSERLSVNAAGWAMYMATVTTDDPATRVNLAEIVSLAVVRQRVLSMATSYTLEEACLLSEMLAENGELSTSDVRESLQLDLLRLIAEGDSVDDRGMLAGGEVLRRRSQRRDDRARRMGSIAQQREEVADRKIAEAEQTVLATQAAHNATLQQALKEQSRADTAEQRVEDTVRVNLRLMRILRVVIVGILLTSFATLLYLTGHITGKYQLIAALGALMYIAAAVQYCHDLEKSGISLLTAAICAGTLSVIELILSTK